MSTVPIGEHALLSDCHSAALVTRAGSVDWLNFPRFDSPAVFARMLDEEAGHWSIRPVSAATVTRRYRDRSMVLETSFATAGGGTLVVTDALALGPVTQTHRLGQDAPHLLVRSVRAEGNPIEIELEYAPRPEFGLVRPLLSEVDGGVTARGGAEWLVLSSPVPLSLDGSTARGRCTVEPDTNVHFGLHRSTLGERPAHVWTGSALSEALDRTLQSWQEWSDAHQSYQGPWRELVHASGRLLQALTYFPSGAIVAAPTTSLPESVGGGRNWDYRYSWIRDASFTMEALWVAACPDEADDFFAFMTTAAAGSVGPGYALQIMFGVGGERDLSERELDQLAGWRGSRPVRVGNGAWRQQQIDVYGELLGAAHRLADRIGAIDEDMRRFLVGLADTAAVRWQETDQGIWEVRGEPRHFLYSKVMCWVALDRAVALADRLGARDRVGDWMRAQDEIRRTVLRQGWNEAVGAFTQSFGSEDLDASALMLPIVGFLPGDDPRVLATVDAIADRLTDSRGLVYRYRTAAGDNADGLAGEEGTFLLCTFWLAQALALAGRTRQARETFERAVQYVNDVGLLAEEVDERTGELLGNFPQAFSHVGLVNAAYAIAEAEASVA